MKRINLLLISLLCGCIHATAQVEQPLQEPADSVKNVGYMDSLFQELPEVMIMGERPIVKAEQGKLVYDVPRLVGNLPVDNAYDILKNLPGIVNMNGSLTLGGQSVTVVINGKVTTLSAEQLDALLKSIPVSRIEKAEVMYSAPARYQVRGPMINLILAPGTGQASSFCTPDVNSLQIFFTLTRMIATEESRRKKRFTRWPTVRYIRWIWMIS